MRGHMQLNWSNYPKQMAVSKGSYSMQYWVLAVQKGSGTCTSANPFPLDPLRQCVICTDGALDSERATWGAIVVDNLTSTRLGFAGAVPMLLLAAWKTLVGDQLICQIERFAVLCIRWRTRHLLKGQRLILFIDNEPCRYALIKGRSASDPLFRMPHA